MEITTKELRIQPGKIIDQVVNGNEVTVTFRGQACVKIVPIKKHVRSLDEDETPIFGLWRNHESDESVEEYVRSIRKGRQV